MPPQNPLQSEIIYLKIYSSKYLTIHQVIPRSRCTYIPGKIETVISNVQL